MHTDRASGQKSSSISLIYVPRGSVLPGSGTSGLAVVVGIVMSSPAAGQQLQQFIKCTIGLPVTFSRVLVANWEQLQMRHVQSEWPIN